MPLTATEYKHIQLDAAEGTQSGRNVSIIAGTTMKVVEVITSVKAYGWTAEEIHKQHPYLTMGQIHSALAYYWDHKEELDADMERRYQFAEKLRQEAGESPLVRKLRVMGLLE